MIEVIEVNIETANGGLPEYASVNVERHGEERRRRRKYIGNRILFVEKVVQDN